jgi:hypothetical protein
MNSVQKNTLEMGQLFIQDEQPRERATRYKKAVKTVGAAGNKMSRQVTRRLEGFTNLTEEKPR